MQFRIQDHRVKTQYIRGMGLKEDRAPAFFCNFCIKLKIIQVNPNYIKYIERIYQMSYFSRSDRLQIFRFLIK